MRKLGHFFFKCVLEIANGTKKELRRSKSKESKGSKLVMLDSSADCFFMSSNIEEISTGLNKKQVCFFYLAFFNIHLRKKIVNFCLSFLNYYTTYGVSNIGTKESQGIPDCSLKTFFYVLICYTIENGHFFEAIKRLLEGCKLSSVLGYFH